ncbi:unnamed protein product, partial [Discosporangium mesarthrocarpum]
MRPSSSILDEKNRKGGAVALAQRFGKRGAPQTFARKLYNILLEDSPIIGWNEKGDTFTVHDSKAFAQETLTKYYRHGKFSSFQRQLNMYGFRKVPNSGRAYSHPFFRRDGPELLSQVRRVTPVQGGKADAVDGDEADVEQAAEAAAADPS